MKILIDAQSIIGNRSGIGHYTFQLLKHLPYQTDKPESIIPFYFNFRRQFKDQHIFKKLHPVLKEKEINFVPGFVMNQLWKRFSWPSINCFFKNFDLVHFPNFTAKPVNKKPFFITIHDLAFKRYPNTIQPKNLIHLERKLEKNIAECSGIFTVSEFSKKEIQYFYSKYKKPIYVTPNGISSQFYSKVSPKNIQKIKNKYKLPENYFLHVGTIEPRKNLTFLLEAFKDAVIKNSELKLVLVGSKGWLSSKFEETFQKLQLSSNVIFPGFIDEEDLPAIYQGGQCFLFPSLYEGFGIPPLEALASGLPVIASDIPVTNEILGSQAQFINLSHGTKAWTQAILNCSSQKRRTIDPNFINQARKFSWENTAKLTFNGYKDFCS